MDTVAISLQLSSDLYEQLQFLSAKTQKNPADIIAQLITAAYQKQQGPMTPAFESILENRADLGVTDLSEQHDHYLYGLEKS